MADTKKTYEELLAESPYRREWNGQFGRDFVESVFRTWDDLRVPTNATQINPAKSSPVFEDLGGGVFAYHFSSTVESDEALHFAAQLPHSYKEGSDISPHIHWTPVSSTGGNVRWRLTTAIERGVDLLTGSTFQDITTLAGTDGEVHLDSFADIDGTGMTISHMIVGNIVRLSTAAEDTHTGKAALLEIDFHYERDSIGSRTEFAK